VILVRHAQPVDDVRGLCYGSLDVELSDTGRAAAADLAQSLRGRGTVYSSPRRRALETAAAISPDVLIDDDLRELDFGELEGRTYDEIAASEPELYRAWMERPTTVEFPGGESFAVLQRRVVAALDRIAEPAIVVTHGGVIRAALARWLSMPDEAIFRFALDYCGVTIVDRSHGPPLVRLVNGWYAAPSAMTD
jgi:alpha-ribazole phosphatase